MAVSSRLSRRVGIGWCCSCCSGCCGSCRCDAVNDEGTPPDDAIKEGAVDETEPTTISIGWFLLALFLLPPPRDGSRTRRLCLLSLFVVVTRDGIDDDDDNNNGGLLENGSIDFMVLLSVGATALLSVSATASALLLLFSLNDASVADDELPSVRRLLLLQGADIAFQWKYNFPNNGVWRRRHCFSHFAAIVSNITSLSVPFIRDLDKKSPTNSGCCFPTLAREKCGKKGGVGKSGLSSPRSLARDWWAVLFLSCSSSPSLSL
jgi:hypothetical protein